jgi:hypothetical protein
MTTSASQTWLIAVLCVVVLAALLVSIWIGMRAKAPRRPRLEPRRGQVQGGTHVGGGRSVGPRRDAEVTPDENPDEPTVEVRRTRGTGIGPMDL